MAKINATQDGETISVKNGDRVSLDLPDGDGIRIAALNGNVRNFRIDFGDDDAVGNTVSIDFTSFTKNGLQILVNGYDSLDRLQLDGAQNVQIGVPKQNEVTFEYGNGLTGKIKILDPGERDLLDPNPPIVICFADGTVIDTALGPRPVESLLVGDSVRTLDNGFQTVRWIGRRRLDAATLAENPDLRPVRIAAGAMGNDLPWTDLIVSPQHRIRVNDWRAELLFGYPDVLIPAKAFLGGEGVDILDDWSGSYFHLLFDRHELLYSNGLVTESLHPGEVALTALDERDVAVMARSTGDQTSDLKTSRPSIKVTEAKAINLFAA